MEDEKLFPLPKTVWTEIAAEGEPFNFTMRDRRHPF